MGALFVPTTEKFRSSRSETALVQSLAIGASVCAVAVGFLVEKYGLCRVAIVGTTLTVAGQGAGFFAMSIAHLHIVSVVADTDITTVFVCSTVALGSATDGRAKSGALVVNSSCIGLGAMMYPHLLAYLSKNFGLNGMYLILAGLCCNDVILVSLLSNVNVNRSKSDEGITHTTTLAESNENQGAKFQGHFIRSLQDEIKYKCGKIFSLPYVLTLIATVLILAALDGYQAVYVDLYKWKKFTEEEGISSMIVYQPCCVAAGILVALLKQIDVVSTFAITASYSLVGCTGMALTYAATSLPVAYVGSGLLGVTEGITSCLSLIVAELAPKDLYGTAFGIIITTQGTVAVAAGPVFGAIRDKTESYAAVCLVVGVIDICAGTLFLVAWLAHRRSATVTSTSDDETHSPNARACDNPSFQMDILSSQATLNM